MAQRVVRKVCEKCRQQYEAPAPVEAQVKEVLGKLYPPTAATPLKLWKGQGCTECGGSGYEGRIGIFEVLQVTEKIGRLILERAPSTEIEKVAAEGGMVKMIQDGFLKAIEGITTIEEVLRVAEDKQATTQI